MIYQRQESNEDYPRAKDAAKSLIEKHLMFDSPSKGVLGERLQHREALQAAIVTAKELARETGASHWYKVLTYLEDNQKIKYGR